MMVKSWLPNALVLLLLCSPGWAQTPADSGAAAGQPPASQGAPAVPPDTALSDLLAQVQAAAQKSDQDLAALHIQKWKADATNRQQAEDNAAAIHRNLANAVPELLQQVRSEPGSLAANFKLYRDLNAVYDTFSALVESAGAFGPADQILAPGLRHRPARPASPPVRHAAGPDDGSKRRRTAPASYPVGSRRGAGLGKACPASLQDCGG